MMFEFSRKIKIGVLTYTFFSFAICFMSCSSYLQKTNKQINEPGIMIKISGKKTAYRLSDTLNLHIKIRKQGFKYSLCLNGFQILYPLKSGSYKIPLNKGKLGSNIFSTSTPASPGSQSRSSIEINIFPADPPLMVTYTVLDQYPHDPPNFSQGLAISGDTIFESSGRYGISCVKKFNYKTGTLYQQHQLDAKYFGEGLTLLNNKVYQLTYKENDILVYERSNLKLLEIRKFCFQGWGLTTDNTNLLLSDGSSKIYVMDPESYVISDTIEVMDNNGSINNINELEYVNGYIFANVWFKDEVIVINPKSGIVEKVIDFNELRNHEPPSLWKQTALNGIAYKPAENKLIITGKNWSKFYEIVLSE